MHVFATGLFYMPCVKAVDSMLVLVRANQGRGARMRGAKLRAVVS